MWNKFLVMGFTKRALEQQEIIKNDYPDLAKHYHIMMGNFSFTKNEVLSNIGSILKWMEQFPEYQLMHQLIDDFDGLYYLTNVFE